MKIVLPIDFLMRFAVKSMHISDFLRAPTDLLYNVMLKSNGLKKIRCFSEDVFE